MTKLEEMVVYLLDDQNKMDNELFFITVKIDGAERDEMIINHISQLEHKVSYYEHTYDEDLHHKHGNFEIIDYGFIPGGSRLSRELEDLI